jgi:erythromycin esterase-like protein
VGIGEGTHRAKEMFQAQCDIIKERIEKHNCRVVFIEADASDVDTISKAMDAKGEPALKPLLAKLFFPTLSSDGIYNLLAFVTKWNQARPGQRVNVVGVDVQSKGAPELLRQTINTYNSNVPLQKELTDLCEVWEHTLALIRKKGSSPTQFQAGCKLTAQVAERVLSKLTDRRSILACDSISKEALLYLQPSDKAMLIRDQLMANRISEYGATPQVSGAVVAHNGHVTFAPPSHFSNGMGSQIKTRPYKALLQLAEQGTLSDLRGDENTGALKAFPALKETDIESVLANVAKTLNTDKPLLINIDALKKDPNAKDLLKMNFNVNSIGTKIPDSHFFTIKLSECCNAIVFHRKISPETWCDRPISR